VLLNKVYNILLRSVNGSESIITDVYTTAAELSTDDAGISGVPAVITDCSVRVVVADKHCSFNRFT
jgi:hypothetical protein